MTTRAIFAGYDASGNTNLWVTDGTAAGTSELTAVGAASGLAPSGITVLGTKALFQGNDASNRFELWVSDGTSGGTTELIPAGANSLGLFGPDGLLNPDFTPLGGKLLIQGYDASGRWGLWVTDGTAAGTSELTVAGADAEGLFSGAIFPDFTVVGNKALFMGEDPRGFNTLWVTDGTLVGTSELTVAGANSSYGVINNGDPDFTRLGNKAIFEGENAKDLDGLWVTDGTAAGTRELTVAGASSFGLGPRSFSVLGTKALFIGTDATSQSGLWVTDGTSAGTSELTGGNIFYSFFTPDPHFTVLGSKMLLMGTDANYHLNLWVTDGTAAGTSQLAVAGASSLGLLADDVFNDGTDEDTDFFSLGAKAIFKGENASGDDGLWVTDGTAAGTSELTVAGAYSGGLFSAALDPDFTALGGKALFLGSDASAHPSLWITDGTSAGTRELAVAGAYSYGLTPSDITAFLPPPAPVTIATNGVTSLVQLGSQYELKAVSSGTGPFLTYNGSTVTTGEFPGWTPVGAAKTATGYEVAWSLGANEYSVWNTDNNGAYTGAATGALSGASYALQKLETSFSEDLNGDGTIGPTLAGPPAAPHDFNNDGLSDILWQSTSGQASIWDMSGSTLAGGGAVSPNPGPSWRAVGTGDFNDDGDSDILWQNANTGQASIWEMNGNTLIGGGSVTPNPGPNWKAIGTGDFTGDGFSDDILWQNANTGQASIWEMDGKTLLGGGAVTPNPGPAWKAIGTGDFNKDGDVDILWQNARSGQVSIWEMDGNKLIGGGAVTPNPGPSSKAIGTGDFNDDGRADILFQNRSSGQVSIWEMNGNALIGGGPLSANPGPSWRAIGTGDFNGDGHSDIVLQNTSGQTSIWDMNGNTIIGGGAVSANAGPNWRAVA